MQLAPNRKLHKVPVMLDQAVIGATGALAAWINHDPREAVRRWGCIVGLVGSPFWLYTTCKAGQWGMFACTVGYTFAFLRGVRVYWIGGR